jgi:hypothetical protein
VPDGPVRIDVLGPLRVTRGGRPVEAPPYLAAVLEYVHLVHPRIGSLRVRRDDRAWLVDRGDGAVRMRHPPLPGPGDESEVMVEVDVVHFRRLADEGRTRAALALWRGTPLADVTGVESAPALLRLLLAERDALVAGLAPPAAATVWRPSPDGEPSIEDVAAAARLLEDLGRWVESLPDGDPEAEATRDQLARELRLDVPRREMLRACTRAALALLEEAARDVALRAGEDIAAKGLGVSSAQVVEAVEGLLAAAAEGDDDGWREAGDEVADVVAAVADDDPARRRAGVGEWLLGFALAGTGLLLIPPSQAAVLRAVASALDLVGL